MLSDDQLQEFRETGLLVVEDVLNADEVQATRDAFHAHLLTSLNIDHDAVLSHTQPPPQHRIKSPVSRIFYSSWKLLNVHLHEKVVETAKDILNKTYGTGNDPDFSHPYGPFKEILAYVDRICWRLPDYVRAEGGLGLHLDRNPFDPYLLRSTTGLTKWRPIQAIVCLTDHFDGESGGLKVVPGFHKEIDRYFSKSETQPDTQPDTNEGGEFFRLNSTSHTALQRRCRPVIAPAGSIVFWDNRLPHATADRLSGADTREVIYTGFLPRVKLNQEYGKRQFEAIKHNRPPPAYEESLGSAEVSDRDYALDILTTEQLGLLGQ